PTAGVDVELRQTLWAFIRRLNHEGQTIVLTTHYLEEAEQLCTRIGMLKSGEVVALEQTSQLLGNYSARRLRVRVSGAAVPPALAEYIVDSPPSEQGWIAFRIDTVDMVENLLRALREAGCIIEDMELTEADLEDIFINIMESA
ncbi:MAG: ABC transporter ATP-binding protein, partial [Burkholderiaceae bacterium]